MKKSLSLMFILFFSFNSYSSIILTNIPLQKEKATITITPEVLAKFATLKIKEIEKLAGRKLTFKEKIAVKVYQWKIKKIKTLSFPKERKSDKGNTAFILGIVGLVSLLIPYLGIVAIPCAILAIIFGNQAKKINPDDRHAKTGAILGWITLALIVLFILLIIAILASGGFWIQ